MRAAGASSVREADSGSSGTPASLLCARLRRRTAHASRHRAVLPCLAHVWRWLHCNATHCTALPCAALHLPAQRAAESRQRLDGRALQRACRHALARLSVRALLQTMTGERGTIPHRNVRGRLAGEQAFTRFTTAARSCSGMQRSFFFNAQLQLQFEAMRGGRTCTQIM